MMMSALVRFHPDLFAHSESASQKIDLPRGESIGTGWMLESIGYSHEELLQLVIVHDCTLSKVSLDSCLDNLGGTSGSAGS